MWLKWLPLRWVISKLARSHGFLDPLTVLARVRRFAQPSEVREPLELLRAGMIFHARGLINSKAIQHNMDWVWPYWVEKQFDPRDNSFVPRAFSLTHINLTQRNWTAVGLPCSEALVVVDPRGLVMPFLDSWSLDTWIITEEGDKLIPSRLALVDQQLEFDDRLRIRTRTETGGMELTVSVSVENPEDPVCYLDVTASSDIGAWAVVSARPYNPEGISFIYEAVCEDDGRSWLINRKQRLNFSETPDRYAVSDYHSGDVFLHLPGEGSRQEKLVCEVGMLTSASLFKIEKDEPRIFRAEIPLQVRNPHFFSPWKVAGADRKSIPEAVSGCDQVEDSKDWKHTLEGSCRLKVPDSQFQFLYEAAVRSLLLHSVSSVYPGPFTYHRFWFRDAAFIIHALLNAGFAKRVGRLLPSFFPYQTKEGFFKSQDGEWDSNGEALWTISRYYSLTGSIPPEKWRKSIYRAARWIIRKRISRKKKVPHAGLFPAGFSAEHLGPNDYYYWDNFWGIGGLYAAAYLAELYGDKSAADEFRGQARDFFQTVDASLKRAQERINRPAMPAAPLRRLDSGAIGSLVAGYPLQLMEADDPRLLDTVEFILESCLVKGGFFQDMIHSGINPYLTIHLAQILLRTGDQRCLDLISTVAGTASSTGQWPEAIHPLTGGGCMGDGQHIWAAAEWLTVTRDCFVQEELFKDRLVLGGGIPPSWLASGEEMSLGSTLTRFGPLSVEIKPDTGGVRVQWSGQWREKEPRIAVRLTGYAEITAEPGEHSVYLTRS
ncbi:MAG: hypothetical protein ACLFV2_08690 [Desulfurivibrionaceae bacterium]